MWCSEAAPAVIPGAGGPLGRVGVSWAGGQIVARHLKCQQEATVMRVGNKCLCFGVSSSPVVPDSPSCLSWLSPQVSRSRPRPRSPSLPVPTAGMQAAWGPLPACCWSPGPLPARPSNLAHTCLSQIFAWLGWCHLSASCGQGMFARRGQPCWGSWDADGCELRVTAPTSELSLGFISLAANP